MRILIRILVLFLSFPAFGEEPCILESEKKGEDSIYAKHCQVVENQIIYTACEALKPTIVQKKDYVYIDAKNACLLFSYADQVKYIKSLVDKMQGGKDIQKMIVEVPRMNEEKFRELTTVTSGSPGIRIQEGPRFRTKIFWEGYQGGYLPPSVMRDFYNKYPGIDANVTVLSGVKTDKK